SRRRRRHAAQPDLEPDGAGRHHHLLHRAGGARRSAAWLDRLPDHFRRRPDPVADHPGLQHPRSVAARQIPRGLLMKPLTTEEIRAVIARGKLRDNIFKAMGVFCLSLALIVIVALIADMVIKGSDRFTLDLFLNFASRRATQAGILSAWVGSLLVMLVTGLAAVPLGVAAGLYLEEYAKRNWITHIIEINITNLAAVPSIVYGLLALGIFVYQFGFGQSILSAGLTLALLILPIIIVSTREAIRAIPAMIREGSMAVGATRWQTCRYHIVPYAMPGILTGIIIGLA